MAKRIKLNPSDLENAGYRVETNFFGKKILKKNGCAQEDVCYNSDMLDNAEIEEF